MISEKKFCRIMSKIRNSWEYQDKLNDFFRNNDVDGYLFQPDCIDQAIELLEYIFHDDKNKWISYFIFELEFGKKYKHGMIIGADGTDIELSSPSQLYDFLINNMGGELS